MLIEPLCQLVLSVAGDPSDSPAQRIAWTLLARFTTHFGKTKEQFDAAAAERAGSDLPAETFHSIPGYEQFVYEAVIPLAFEVPNHPRYNIKDGQAFQARNTSGHLQIVSTYASL